MHLAEQGRGRQRHIIEPDLAQFAGLVDRRQQCDGEPGGVLRHQEQADPVLHRAAVAGARGDDEDIGQMRVADKELGTGEGKACLGLARREGDAGRVPAQRRLGPGERRLLLAGSDARQPFAALRRGAGLGDRRPAEQHGRQEWPRHDRAPHLLHQDDEIDQAEPAAAIRFRVDDAEPALLGELLPEFVGDRRRFRPCAPARSGCRIRRREICARSRAAIPAPR